MRSAARVSHPIHRRVLVAIATGAAGIVVGLPVARTATAGAASAAAHVVAEHAGVVGRVAAGKRLFTKYYCYSCHGTDGQGGAGLRLKPPNLPPFEVFRRYVRKPSGRMPAYRSSALPDAALEDIYAYLKSIPVPAASNSIRLLNQ